MAGSGKGSRDRGTDRGDSRQRSTHPRASTSASNRTAKCEHIDLGRSTDDATKTYGQLYVLAPLFGRTYWHTECLQLSASQPLNRKEQRHTG